MTAPQPKKMGRPVGGALPPEQQTKPRTVRLSEARWARLKELGTGWLERQIDRAK